MDDESPEPQVQTRTARGKRPREEDETETQRLKRAKAAERQRKKRERDRARALTQAEAEQAESEAQFAAEQARIRAEEQEAEQRAAHTAAHAAAQAAVALLFPPPPPHIAEEMLQHFTSLHLTHPHLVPVPIAAINSYSPQFQPLNPPPGVAQDPLLQPQGPSLEIVHEDGISSNPRPSTQFATDAAARAARKEAEDANMTPEEIARRDKVRADARERQRRHRAAVKERKNQDLGLDPPPEEPPKHAGPVEFVHVTPGDAGPSSSTPLVNGGQTFASTLLLSFSSAPMLKAYVLRTLNMTNEELASFEPILAAAWDKWNAERQANREQNRDGLQPFSDYPTFPIGMNDDGSPALPPHVFSSLHHLPPLLPPRQPLQYRPAYQAPSGGPGRERVASTQASTSSQPQAAVSKQTSRRPRSQPQTTRRQARAPPERQPTEPLSPPRQQQELPQSSPTRSPTQRQQHPPPPPPPPPTFAMSDGPDLSRSIPAAPAPAPPRASTPPPTTVVVDANDFRNRISALAGGRLGFTRSFTSQSSTYRSPYDQATMNSSSSSIGSIALPPDASLFDSPPRPVGT